MGGIEKGSEKNLARNMLGIAPRVLAGWVALHGASDFPAQAAEIPNGTPWQRGLTMMHEDAASKPYEVGGSRYKPRQRQTRMKSVAGGGDASK